MYLYIFLGSRPTFYGTDMFFKYPILALKLFFFNLVIQDTFKVVLQLDDVTLKLFDVNFSFSTVSIDWESTLFRGDWAWAQFCQYTNLSLQRTRQ